jgi:hypothetical protein
MAHARQFRWLHVPAWICAALSVLDCNPAGPTKDPRCSNDPVMRTTCVPEHGSDIQCTAYGYYSGLYICDPDTRWPLTENITWLSTDTSVAAFGVPGAPPGYLKVLRPGWVEIVAQYPLANFGGAQAFDVSPGIPPVELEKLRVNVADAAAAFGSLSGVTVTAVFDKSGPQSCVTAAKNGGSPDCQFWMYRGSVTVTASAAGYQDATVSSASRANEKGLSITVKLTRLP